MAQQPRRPSLQVERTELSWERTAIGFLVSGAIPLLRPGGPLAVGRTSLAITAVLLALLVVWLSRTRAHRIRIGLKAGASAVPAATVGVPVIGWATCGFATMIAVGLIIRM
jgi:putative membrane protein